MTGERFTLLAGLCYHHVHSYYEPLGNVVQAVILPHQARGLALNPYRSHVTDVWVLRPVIRIQSRSPPEAEMNCLTKD